MSSIKQSNQSCGTFKKDLACPRKKVWLVFSRKLKTEKLYCPSAVNLLNKQPLTRKKTLFNIVTIFILLCKSNYKEKLRIDCRQKPELIGMFEKINGLVC